MIINDSHVGRVAMVCPGCEAWQIEYDYTVQEQWPILKIGSSGVGVDLTPFYQDLDHIVATHLRECPGTASGFLLAQAAQPLL